MKVYLIISCTSDENVPNIFGVYSTKDIAYCHANKLIKKYRYDNNKWFNDGRTLEH